MGRLSTKSQLLDFLRANPTEFSVMDLALALNLSYDTCRKHLSALITEDEGVTRSVETPDGVGRPAHVYMYVG